MTSDAGVFVGAAVEVASRGQKSGLVEDSSESKQAKYA